MNKGNKGGGGTEISAQIKFQKRSLTRSTLSVEKNGILVKAWHVSGLNVVRN